MAGRPGHYGSWCYGFLPICGWPGYWRFAMRPTAVLARSFAAVAAVAAAALTSSAGALTSPAGAAAAPGAAAPACAWATEISADALNELYPDAGAAYWVLPFPVLDGLVITLSGHFPDSRYASVQVYQPGGGLFTTNG